MCDQREAMRAVRAAAACLSAACRARDSDTIEAMKRAWDDTLEEPVPPALIATLERLGTETKH